MIRISEGNVTIPFCLCQYLDAHLSDHTLHLCLFQHSNSNSNLWLQFKIIDSFSPNTNRADIKIASAIRNGVDYYIDNYVQHQQLAIDSIWLLQNTSCIKLIKSSKYCRYRTYFQLMATFVVENDYHVLSYNVSF